MNCRLFNYINLPFVKVGVYPNQDVFHRYLCCSDGTASGQLC